MVRVPRPLVSEDVGGLFVSSPILKTPCKYADDTRRRIPVGEETVTLDFRYGPIRYTSLVLLSCSSHRCRVHSPEDRRHEILIPHYSYCVCIKAVFIRIEESRVGGMGRYGRRRHTRYWLLTY